MIKIIDLSGGNKMGEKFIFITKKDPDQKFTAQKSLDRENEFIVMWQTKSGRLCGILYDELEIKNGLITDIGLLLKI
jgi:hypothetical protein